jgi:hypothetical protein
VWHGARFTRKNDLLEEHRASTGRPELFLVKDGGGGSPGGGPDKTYLRS